MTRAQYVTLCIIGGMALVAFFQSFEVAQAMRRSGMMPDKSKDVQV